VIFLKYSRFCLFICLKALLTASDSPVEALVASKQSFRSWKLIDNFGDFRLSRCSDTVVGLLHSDMNSFNFPTFSPSKPIDFFGRGLEGTGFLSFRQSGNWLSKEGSGNW